MFKRKPVAKSMSREEFLRRRPFDEAGGEGSARFADVLKDVLKNGGEFKGNPAQLAKLKDGVEAWNAWRRANPSAAVDLRGATIWGSDLRNVELWKADISGAELRGVNLGRADLGGANFSGSMLWDVDFALADLHAAKFVGTFFSDCNFSGANLRDVDLVSAKLWDANLTGAYIGEANFLDCSISGLSYSKRLLRNRCHGARVSECYGDAQFRRDVMDQDILDQRLSQVKLSATGTNLGNYSPQWWLSALFNGIQPLSILAGLIVGLLFKAMILPVDASSLLSSLLDGHYTDLLAFLPFVAGGIGVAVFLAGTLGRLFGYWVWSLFDFGRDWGRVVLFAFVMVLAFGGVYAQIDGVHVTLASEGGHVWFYPWFTALMGFATLGIADFVTPITNLGAVVIMANVLSGFVTLGLLLSVLGDGFARRS